MPLQPARGLDAEIAALGERQHGVVARRQLEAIGLGRGAIGSEQLERPVAAGGPGAMTVLR